MTSAMPLLTTERLRIRPFRQDDLEAIHRIQDEEFSFVGGEDRPLTWEERRAYLEWSIANHEQMGSLYQPPYGDKAMELVATCEVIGICGLVPALGPFSQVPSLGRGAPTGRMRPEVGLYYQVARNYRGRGYAVEAARALARYGLDVLRLERVIATTTYDNVASIAVMENLGMSIYRNPLPHPEWFQVVGVLEAE